MGTEMSGKLSIIAALYLLNRSLVNNELISRFPEDKWMVSGLVIDDNELYIKCIFDYEYFSGRGVMSDPTEWFEIITKNFAFHLSKINPSLLIGYKVRLAILFNNERFMGKCDSIALINAFTSKNIYDFGYMMSLYDIE